MLILAKIFSSIDVKWLCPTSREVKCAIGDQMVGLIVARELLERSRVRRFSVILNRPSGMVESWFPCKSRVPNIGVPLKNSALNIVNSFKDKSNRTNLSRSLKVNG